MSTYLVSGYDLRSIYHPKTPRISIQPRIEHIHHKFVETKHKESIIMIDGDNVRGKASFTVSKERLCDDITCWMKYLGLEGRVVVIFDHGSNHEAYYIKSSGLTIVFAGPTNTADDIISRDVRWIQENMKTNVIVVTEDHQLKRRCHTASMSSRISKKKKKKEIMNDPNSSEVMSQTFYDVDIVGSPTFVEMLYEKSSFDDDNDTSATVATENDIFSGNADSSIMNMQSNSVTDIDSALDVNNPVTTTPTVPVHIERAHAIRETNLELIEMLRKESSFRQQMMKLKEQLIITPRAINTKLDERIQVLIKRLNAVIQRSSIIDSDNNNNDNNNRNCIIPNNPFYSNQNMKNTTNNYKEIIISKFVNGTLDLLTDDTNNNNNNNEFPSTNIYRYSLKSDSTKHLLAVQGVDDNQFNGFFNSEEKKRRIIEKLFAETRALSHVEEKWERIILAERMRILLNTTNNYRSHDIIMINSDNIEEKVSMAVILNKQKLTFLKSTITTNRNSFNDKLSKLSSQAVKYERIDNDYRNIWFNLDNITDQTIHETEEFIGNNRNKRLNWARQFDYSVTNINSTPISDTPMRLLADFSCVFNNIRKFVDVGMANPIAHQISNVVPFIAEVTGSLGKDAYDFYNLLYQHAAQSGIDTQHISKQW
eukprot:gene14628-19647_t